MLTRRAMPVLAALLTPLVPAPVPGQTAVGGLRFPDAAVGLPSLRPVPPASLVVHGRPEAGPVLRTDAPAPLPGPAPYAAGPRRDFAMILGAVAGAAAGAGIACAIGDCEGDVGPPGDVVLGGLAGAVLGALVALWISPDDVGPSPWPRPETRR